MEVLDPASARPAAHRAGQRSEKPVPAAETGAQSAAPRRGAPGARNVAVRRSVREVKSPGGSAQYRYQEHAIKGVAAGAPPRRLTLSGIS